MLKFIFSFPFIFRSYTKHFKSIFSKKLFKVFEIYLISLCLEFKRFNINQISQNTKLANYQKIQYYLSDAKWSATELNSARLSLLHKSKHCKTTKKGVIILDDTSNRKWGKKSEGVDYQYSSLEKKEILSHVCVMSAYADNKKSFPLHITPYIPASRLPDGEADYRFKSKHKIGLNLLDQSIEEDIKFRLVVFDSWYFGNDFVKDLNSRNIYWLTESKSDRLISFRGKWTRVDDLVKVITTKFKHKLRAVTLPTSTGEKKRFWVYRFYAKIHGLPGRYLIVISIGSWIEFGDDSDKKDVKVFVSNCLSLESSEVLRSYSLRFKIEYLFKELKDNFYFDQYQVTSLKDAQRHWYLSILAYTFILRLKLTGSLKNIVDKDRTLITLEDHIRAFRDIFSLKNYQHLDEIPYDKIKSLLKIRAKKIA